MAPARHGIRRVRSGEPRDPLSYPSSRWPLLSLPRFGLVIFPLFLALAALTADRPRLHTAVIACSSVFLGVAVVQWALWQWVA